MRVTFLVLVLLSAYTSDNIWFGGEYASRAQQIANDVAVKIDRQLTDRLRPLRRYYRGTS
jgi:hypothetical protein